MTELRFVHLGFGPEFVEYTEAWDEQRRVHAARFADEIEDTCLLLEHRPVYTAGRRTADNERPLDGTPVVDVDRGGKITWHGPGQLVGYPIMKLPRPVDVVAHVRRLEDALIRTAAEFGLETTRIEGRSGVWVLGDPVEDRPSIGGLSLDLDPRMHDDEFDARLNGPEYAPSNAGQRREDRKLAAIGIRVAKGVTMHGFAINVNPDNTWFDRIVPCGIRDAGVTSLSYELGREITIAQVVPVIERHLKDVLEQAELRRGDRARRRLRARGMRPAAPRLADVRTYEITGVPWWAPKNRSHREPVVSAVAPDGRKMLRLEVRNAQTPIERKPEWIKTRAKMGPEYTKMQALVKGEGLHTVCQEAGCPNIYECWEDREATFLIGGDQCTRRCDFCQIDTGKPEALDRDEPRRVGESVVTMDLNYATITGVARDDLPDGGAWLYAETVRQIHQQTAGRETGHTKVELLAPDFNAVPELLEEVFASRPEVFAHNVETVPRIFKRIRPGFRYERSLDVITKARAYGLITKSNLILGMGEEREEVTQALKDLHEAAASSSPSPSTCVPRRGTTPSSGGSSRPSSSSWRRRPRRSASPV